MARREGFKRRFVISTSLLLFFILVLLLGTWFWRSMGYVSSDDARVEADVVTISTEVAGRLVALTKEEGDSVLPGDVLARLDSRQVEIAIRQAEADITKAQGRWLQAKRGIEVSIKKQQQEMAKAKAALQRYRHDLADARIHAEGTEEDWWRAKELFKRQLVSKQSLSHDETKMQQAKARVFSLEAKVKEAVSNLKLAKLGEDEISVQEEVLKVREAELQHAEERLADLQHELELMTIRSPAKGKIARQEAQRGEFVQPGQPIYMVVDSSEYWVEANVEETKIRHVKPGAEVIVQLDSYPGENFEGTVLDVGEATVSAFSLFSPAKLTGVFVKSTQRLPVKIAVENADGRLKVGMLAVVWIKKEPGESWMKVVQRF